MVGIVKYVLFMSRRESEAQEIVEMRASSAKYCESIKAYYVFV
jgi:hypothetical protein